MADRNRWFMSLDIPPPIFYCLLCEEPVEKHGCEVNFGDNEVTGKCRNARIDVRGWKIIEGRIVE